MGIKDIWGLLVATFWRWYEDNPFRTGAALAYYTVFSLAPIVVIVIAVGSLFFDEDTVRKHFSQEMSGVAGKQVGEAVMAFAKQENEEGTGLLATLVSVAVLLVGATTVFAQLQEALNLVWRVKPNPKRSWLGAVRDRVLSFTIVLGIGFLLLVSLVVSTLLTALNHFLTPSSMPGGEFLWQAINWIIAFGLITLLFAMIYKILPDAKIAWRDVWMGAAVTSLLFNVGKYLIGLYLGHSSLMSTYGAAGSLVAILLWVFYSSQILLFGAEFTFVNAKMNGHPIQPARNAVPIHDESEEFQGTSSRIPMGRKEPQEVHQGA
jgi:membrane protein